MRTKSAAIVAVVSLAALFAPPVRAADDKNAGPPAWLYPQDWKCAGRRLTMHEPQVMAFDATNAKVTLRFPATMTDSLGRSTFGAIEVFGAFHADLSSRLMKLDSLTPGTAVFPFAAPAEVTALQGGLDDALPKSITLRIELVTARPGGWQVDPAPPKFTKEAPQVFVRLKPAVLVQVDGEPVLYDIEEFPIQYVGNTASDVFRDPKSDMWYLLVDGTWLQSKALAGPWKRGDGSIPTIMSQLPTTHPRAHVRRFVPGTPEFMKRGPTPVPKEFPEIIVTDKPSELVLLAGDPLFAFVPGVRALQSVLNTESDLFLHLPSNLYWLLVSGRWFSAQDVEGPWSLNDRPPDEFLKVPRDNVRGHIVWCVPGSPEAAEACVFASIEERATLNKYAQAQVKFEPDETAPVTAPLEGDLKDVKFVKNTEDDVFVVGKAFYTCQRGTWYTSDNGTSGWKACASVPEAMQRLPEDSGSYHVNFCKPLGLDGDFANYSIRGGYHGVYALKGAPVYGTGTTKRGLTRKGNWYPCPRTYGENRWFDPATNTFQPRSVRPRADGSTTADEWSPYTASYGRVTMYASRYDQGGRRMFPFSEEEGKFVTAISRPDPYALWLGQLKKKEGLDLTAFPFGDRATEGPPAEPRLAADAEGHVWRSGAKGPETFDKGSWTAGKPSAEIVAWLDTLARIDARPAQWKRWREQRAAPIPVNATVTPKAK
jgi:hypothetical protein